MNLRVDLRSTAGLLGTVLKFLTVPLLLPLATAAVYGEPVLPFLVTMLVTLALGFGLERLAMVLYGIDDIRYFYQNDARFLRQFA